MLLAGRKLVFRVPLALALLALQVSPPVLVHAHPAGGKPMPAEQGLRHEHGHGHGHSHSHHGHAHGPVASSHHDRLAEAGVHGHYFLLGFEFTLPAPDRDPSDSDKGDTAHREYTAGRAVRLLDDGLPAPQDGLWGLNSAVALPAAFSPPDLSFAARESRRGVAVSPWLCDSARHERSGVQLI